MGFIKTNHEVENMGIVLPEAYAQISYISVDINGGANVIFAVQQSREDVSVKDHIDTISYRCTIDKDLPVYKQIYEKAKADIFQDWEDDIVEWRTILLKTGDISHLSKEFKQYWIFYTDGLYRHEYK